MGWTSSRYEFRMVFLFLLMHAGVLAVFFVPFSPRLLLWTAATYAIRMFAVTAGYHRYFSHRSYKLGRGAQFCMAALAQSSGQKGVLWWAAHHRWHHRHSDAEPDVHSPGLRGFWWAHVGWILSNEFDGYDERQIADFAKFPELRWLDSYHWVPAAIFALLVLLIGGFGAFVWGFLLSTVLLYHATFCINSLAHVFGSRRFQTRIRAATTGFWRCSPSAKAGITTITFRWPVAGRDFAGGRWILLMPCWWEVDITYAVLKVLSYLGIACDLRPFRVPSQRVRRAA